MGCVPSYHNGDGTRSGCCLCAPKLGAQQRRSRGACSRSTAWQGNHLRTTGSSYCITGESVCFLGVGECAQRKHSLRRGR